MKWKCTYPPEEEKEAGTALAVLLRLFPGAKVRRDKSREPKRAIYVTTCGPGKLAASGKPVDTAAPLGYNEVKE